MNFQMLLKNSIARLVDVMLLELIEVKLMLPEQQAQRVLPVKILEVVDFRHEAQWRVVEVSLLPLLMKALHNRQRIRAMHYRLNSDRSGIFRTSHRQATRLDQMIHRNGSQEYVTPMPTLALRFSLERHLQLSITWATLGISQ
jgi:hypothetical protein